jgi:lysophospholipase L1-like esterase
LFCCLSFVSPAQNPAIIAQDRLAEPWWAERHNALLEQIKTDSGTQLLLIGDSITNNFEKAKLPDENFEPTWRQFYAPRKALNLGFSGDTTSNVLWRLEHGELAGLHPKAAVVLIGTDNTAHGQSAEQTEAGIDAVVAELEQRLPDTKILLLGILPSGISNQKNSLDGAVNQYLAACYGENPRVTYLDIGSIFYKAGELISDIFYDPRLPQPGKPLHPDSNGQRMLAEAIEPALAKLMGGEPSVPLASMRDINTALIPVEKLEQDSYDWYARHHAELELQKKMQPRVVMIGDSITHFWGGEPDASNHVNGPTAWQRLFGDMPVMNMGFGWDRTQNVLWRLRQGEFTGVSPQWVVIAIGTNNLSGTKHARSNTPDEIADGIVTIADEVKHRSPHSHIVVMGVFPRGKQAATKERTLIKEINELLAKRLNGDAAITFVDIGSQFLSADGSIPAALMPDSLHPSDAGYQIWAQALSKIGIKP